MQSIATSARRSAGRWPRPATARLQPVGARLRATSKATVVRGNAVWRLGDLAPGAKRTVRGTVRIKAGTPGLKRNLVLASAVNAQMAKDEADTLLVAQRRVIPAVTG